MKNANFLGPVFALIVVGTSLLGCSNIRPAVWEANSSGVTPDSGLPYHVYINGERWYMEAVTSLPNDNAAVTLCAKATIQYIPQANPALMRDNIAHELFHAGDCVHGGDTWWNSENPDNVHHIGVYHLGYFMSTLLHENPDLAKWFTR